MKFRKNVDSQCCMSAHKDKIVPGALLTLTIALMVTGFIIGRRFLGKEILEELEELDELDELDEI